MKSASYKPDGSRASLEKHEFFGPAFIAAKDRIRNMDVRFVEEVDPLRQALLEMYAAIALKTPHNSFENHWNQFGMMSGVQTPAYFSVSSLPSFPLSAFRPECLPREHTLDRSIDARH